MLNLNQIEVEHGLGRGHAWGNYGLHEHMRLSCVRVSLDPFDIHLPLNINYASLLCKSGGIMRIRTRSTNSSRRAVPWSRKRSIALTAMFAMVSSILASPAVAEPKESSPTAVPKTETSSDYLASVAPETLARQESLMKYKSWLVELPGIYESGFVESANFADTMSVTQLWAGHSPLQNVARTEAAKRGINLTVHSVQHSRADLQKATDALWTNSKSAEWGGFVMTAVIGTGLTHDGLIVQGHYNDMSTTSTESKLTRASGFAKSLAPEVVEVRVGETTSNTATRSTDIAPYNAGGMMRGSNGRGCSSGFGIFLGNTSRTTTARHCTAASYSAWSSSGNSYGTTLQTVSGSGARVLTGGGFGWMFDGAWNEATQYTKIVKGYADLSIGDSVCTSGANSGVHCDIGVESMFWSVDDGFGPFWTISATQRGGGVANVEGDSGGPVMVPYSDANWTTVGAAGMIQWGNSERTCGSIRVSALCFNRVGFSSMRTIVNDIGQGATLRTG